MHFSTQRDSDKTTFRIRGIVFFYFYRPIRVGKRVSDILAPFDRQDRVSTDDIKKAAIPSLSHRIVFQNTFFKNGDPGADLVAQILESLPVPSEQINFSRR